MSTEDLLRRVEELEQRLGRAEAELPQPGQAAGAATVQRLSEAVEALAADASDLHHQLSVLVAVQERLAAGPDAAVDEPLAGFGDVEDQDLAPPEAPRRPLPIRVARRALRSTVGLLRRVWQASAAPEVAEVRARLVAGEAPLPRLSLVAVAAGVDLDGVRASLGVQTDLGYELAAWDCRSGDYVVAHASGALTSRGRTASPHELVQALAGDFVADISHLRCAPSPTFVETIRWLLASEGLRLLELDCGFGEARVIVASRDLWSPGGVQPGPLEALARSRPERVLGKSVARCGASSGAIPGRVSLGPGGHAVLRQVGPWLVPRAARRPVLDHPVKLPRGPHEAPDADDHRPAVLVVVSTPLVAGLDQVVAGQLRALADASRLVVVAAPAHDRLSGRRLRALAGRTPRVYPIGELFAEPLWLPLLAQLAEEHGATTVLHVGDHPWWYAQLGRLRRIAPGLRLVDQPTSAMAESAPRFVDEIDHHLALTPGIGRGLVDGWDVAPDRVVQLPAVWSSPASVTVPTARVAEVRAELGAPEGSRLVVMAADLVAGSRPEDLVAVARRFQNDTDVWFVLEGDGPLAASMTDLVRLLAVERITLTRPVRCPADLAAAADVVCCPGESEVPVEMVVEALAAGRPLVAASTETLIVLEQRLGGRRLGLVPRGDLDALEGGLRDALAGHRDRVAGEVCDILAGEAERAAASLRQVVLPSVG